MATKLIREMDWSHKWETGQQVGETERERERGGCLFLSLPRVLLPAAVWAVCDTTAQSLAPEQLLEHKTEQVGDWEWEP